MSLTTCLHRDGVACALCTPIIPAPAPYVPHPPHGPDRECPSPPPATCEDEVRLLLARHDAEDVCSAMARVVSEWATIKADSLVRSCYEGAAEDLGNAAMRLYAATK